MCVGGLWPTVTVENCSLPFTFNGHLYEKCVQTVTDVNGPCNQFACVLSRRVWAYCIPPIGISHLFYFLLLTFVGLCTCNYNVDVKVKGKGQVLDIALLHDEHVLRSALHKFTVSEVAADWHELIIPHRIVRPSIHCPR